MLDIGRTGGRDSDDRDTAGPHEREVRGDDRLPTFSREWARTTRKEHETSKDPTSSCTGANASPNKGSRTTPATSAT
jgi:hypothetical protein